MSALPHAQPSATLEKRNPDFVAVLDHLGVLQVSGEDAASFLQGQLSVDVEGLGPGESTFGAYCTPKGRMLASFLRWRDETGFLAALSRDLATATQKQLSKFVLRAKVKVLDASDSIVLAGATGPNSERALSASPGTSLRLRDGRLLHALSAAAAPRVLSGIELADAARWRWLDIRAGLPWITAATRDQLIPQMANLELIGGLSFDKGCYTGLEIVARTQHLGAVKRRTFLANVAAPARPGDALYSDDLGAQASGTVINAEPSPEGGYDLLAAVHTSSRERSTVRLQAPDGPALRFLPLPYAIP
jgi:folate-binding protein YgfZ